MNVWIVFRYDTDCNEDCVAVYGSKESAKAFCDHMNSTSPSNYRFEIFTVKP